MLATAALLPCSEDVQKRRPDAIQIRVPPSPQAASKQRASSAAECVASRSSRLLLQGFPENCTAHFELPWQFWQILDDFAQVTALVPCQGLAAFTRLQPVPRPCGLCSVALSSREAPTGINSPLVEWVPPEARRCMR